MDKLFKIRSIQNLNRIFISCQVSLHIHSRTEVSSLTASVRGELPEVQIFHGEVDKSRQFAGSDASFWEALQIWTSEAVKENRLYTVNLRETCHWMLQSAHSCTHKHTLTLSVITVNKHTDDIPVTSQQDQIALEKDTKN